MTYYTTRWECDWQHKWACPPKHIPTKQYLSLERGDALPGVGVGVVALHRVQLVAVVAAPDGVDVLPQDAHAVVGPLLQQGLDGAPAVVSGVVPGGRTQRTRVDARQQQQPPKGTSFRSGDSTIAEI